MTASTDDSPVALDGLDYSEAPRPWGLTIGHLPGEQRRFLLLCVACGCIALGICIIMVLADPRPPGLHFVLILGLFLATNYFRGFDVRSGNQFYSYRFWELPCLLGVAVGPYYLVPLAAAVAWIISTAPRILDPDPDDQPRLLFDFGVLGTSMFLAAALAQGPANPVAGYLIAALGSRVFVEVLNSRYEALDGNTNALRDFRNLLWMRLGIAALVAGISVTMLLIPRDTRLFAALVPIVLLVVGRVTFEVSSIIRDRDQWKQMERISQRLVGEFNEDLIVRIALTSALELFAARTVEIRLAGADGFRYRARPGPGRATEVGVTPNLLVTDDGAASAEFANALEIDLNAGHQSLGVLRLVFPRSRKHRDNNEQQQLIRMFGHAVASNLAVARAHTEIGHQAATKAHQATHDALTGLGNRAMLYEAAPLLLNAQAATGNRCALLLLDLDGFKRINDTLGHIAGDEVLQAVATRLSDVIREDDLAIRLGGDEFAILARNLRHPSDATLVAAKVITELVPPISTHGMQLLVDVSVGVAVHPDDATNLDDLYKVADIAMYQAKARGGSQAARYEPSGQDHTHQALTLAADLSAAIERGHPELTLHYQPQIEITTGRITGVEALSRWNHPTLGLLGPCVFVPIAEHSGLIRAFTHRVVEHALHDRALMRHALPSGTVSVNFSAKNLLDQSLPTHSVAPALAANSLDASELVIEVTETYALTDASAADTVLAGLREMGCQIALDDFGTGFSTLGALRRGPIAEVKIDRGFIDQIHDTEADRTMVDAVIKMAQARGARVVAEGVETPRMLATLAALGCDAAQGFLIARPMPLTDLMDWLSRLPTDDEGVPVFKVNDQAGG